MSNDASLPAAERRGYSSVFNAVTRITAEEGPAAFYRGSQPFVMRAMVVGGTQVATYDQLKGIYSSLGVPDGLPNQFCSSMSAGLIYSIITMPLETAKNRMAFQSADPATGKLPCTHASIGLERHTRTHTHQHTRTAHDLTLYLVSSLACTHTVYTDTSTFQTCTKVASAEGIFSLWYGFLPYYGRCGGHTVTMFVAVDQIRTIYRKMMMGEK